MRFRTSLERVEATLSLPQPQRALVVAELAADLEDMYACLLAEGVASADAERRALERLLPDPDTLRQLEALHMPLYRRLVSRLSSAGRSRVERAAVVTLTVLVVAATAASLPLGGLTHDPSPFLVPVVVLGCAGLLAALFSALQLMVVGVSSARDGARGLDAVLLLALAAPYVALTGMVIDFHAAAGRIMIEPEQAAAVLNALLRADGILLVCALCLSLLISLSWLLLRARVATLQAAEAAPSSKSALTVIDGRRERDVA
jgi:hypothetical protein